MKSAPISGASVSPASVSSGMRARRAFSCSVHSAAFRLASMLISSRRRADEPQELCLQILFLDTQTCEVDSRRDQSPGHLLGMAGSLCAGEAERASRPILRVHIPAAAINRKASLGQCRARALAVTRVHLQPAHTPLLHLGDAQLLKQTALVDHAEAGGDARDLAEQMA